MRPICFACEETLPLAPETIAAQILDLARWREFTGYAFLPGIASATFDVRTEDVVGTSIRVINTDGSSHVEEIVDWQPSSTVTLRFGRFSPPVSRLAWEFEERWDFVALDGSTRVIRSFQLHAKSTLGWLALWFISFILKRAIARHLRQMRDSAIAAKT